MSAVTADGRYLLGTVSGLVGDVVQFVLLDEVESPTGGAEGMGPVFTGLEQGEGMDFMIPELGVVVDAGLGSNVVGPCSAFRNAGAGSAGVGRETVGKVLYAGGRKGQNGRVVRGRELLSELVAGIERDHLLERQTLDEGDVVLEGHIALEIRVIGVLMSCLVGSGDRVDP